VTPAIRLALIAQRPLRLGFVAGRMLRDQREGFWLGALVERFLGLSEKEYNPSKF
jgi:hypothetical protein